MIAPIGTDSRTCAGFRARWSHAAVCDHLQRPGVFGCYWRHGHHPGPGEGPPKNETFDHPYAFQLFGIVFGYLTVARLNWSYNRYWEGVTHIKVMHSKWADAATQVLAFDRLDDSSTSIADDPFCRHIVRLFSQLSALATMRLHVESELKPGKGGRASWLDVQAIAATKSSSRPEDQSSKRRARLGCAEACRVSAAIRSQEARLPLSGADRQQLTRCQQHSTMWQQQLWPLTGTAANAVGGRGSTHRWLSAKGHGATRPFRSLRPRQLVSESLTWQPVVGDKQLGLRVGERRR